MAKDQLAELVFIAPPGMGHLLPMVQMAEMLIASSSNRISAVIPIMKSSYPDDKISTYIQSVKSCKKSLLNFIELPPSPLMTNQNKPSQTLSTYMRTYKNIFEQALLHRYQASSPPQLSGFVLDMFCTPMIEVADKLGTPSYIFFASGASFLRIMFHIESALHADVLREYRGNQMSDDEIVIDHVAGFNNPVPLKVLPRVCLDKDVGPEIIEHVTRFRRAKGIMVNTFMELESSLIQSFSSSDPSTTNHDYYGQIPPVYPVGPILNIKDDSSSSDTRDSIMNWLDSQPDSSVVFLCFGSKGTFNEDQVKEIATGLEQSGQRFLWSLRKQPVKNYKKEGSTTLTAPTEYDDFNQVLPEGFLDRTAGVGKVIGWAPQVAVLSHRAVGAFVSHCGWNSTLESLWFGVPMLTWPIWAEQQLNAFELVKELGLAVEIKLDYVSDPRKGVSNMVVSAEEVELGIRKMMEEEEGERVMKKVKEMSKEARKALLDAGVGGGGSSYQSIRRFLEDEHINVN